MTPRPAVLGIAGPSGAGKTTWICRIVSELERQGIRIATVKTCHCDPDIEPDHKDSARLLAAGARQVLLVAPGKSAIIERASRSEDVIERFIEMCGVDLVIVEGARESDWPKVALLATDGTWNLPEIFPILARVGHPPVDETIADWSDPEEGVKGIREWLKLRQASSGVLGIVLAGGRGLRLGGMNKAALMYENQSLARRSVALLGTYLSQIKLTGPATEQFVQTGLQVLRDAEHIEGPMGGLVAGLRQCSDGILTCAVDQIALGTATIARMLEEGLKVGSSVLVSGVSGDQLHPTVGFVHRSRLIDVERIVASGERSLRGLHSHLGSSRVIAPAAETVDVDQPEDLVRHCISE